MKPDETIDDLKHQIADLKQKLVEAEAFMTVQDLDVEWRVADELEKVKAEIEKAAHQRGYTEGSGTQAHIQADDLIKMVESAVKDKLPGWVRDGVEAAFPEASPSDLINTIKNLTIPSTYVGYQYSHDSDMHNYEAVIKLPSITIRQKMMIDSLAFRKKRF